MPDRSATARKLEPDIGSDVRAVDVGNLFDFYPSVLLEFWDSIHQLRACEGRGETTFAFVVGTGDCASCRKDGHPWQRLLGAHLRRVPHDARQKRQESEEFFKHAEMYHSGRERWRSKSTKTNLAVSLDKRGSRQCEFGEMRERHG